MLWATFLVIALGYYFSHDIVSLQRFFSHAEFTVYYPAFRQWFFENLLSGHFPKWNPYWGIGHTTEIASSFPVDLFSPLEWAFGPTSPVIPLARTWALLGAGLLSFVWLGISPWVAAICSWLFLLSPWTNYYFFYPLKVSSFIGVLIAAPAAYHWFRTGLAKYWIFSVWITALALFGTKLEYWFFHFVFLTCFGGVAAILFHGVSRFAIRAFLQFTGALALALVIHAWQLVPLLQILGESGRVESSFSRTLFSSEMYLGLYRSVASSSFLSITFSCAAILGVLRCTGKARWLAAYLFFIAVFFWRAWTNPLFAALYGSYALGAGIGFLVWAFEKRPNWRTGIEAICFFLPISFYWCRLGPGDVKELEILRGAPAMLQAIFGALAFWGSCRVADSRRARLIYATLLLLFVIRDQGQIVLCYLSGFYWIPTRDNFLFDALFMALGGIGICGFTKRKVPFLIGAVLIASVFATRHDLYYSNKFMVAATPELPDYRGTPGGEALVRELKDGMDWRGSFISVFGRGFEGVSLLNRAPEVSAYSSLLPARYRDWVLFRKWLIHPDEKLGSHPGQYTPETMANLPKRNTMGWDNDRIYFWRVEARPPFEISALRLLGVRHVISDEPFQHTESELTDYRQTGQFYVARVRDPLPRAFVLDGIPAAAESELSDFITPRFSKDAIYVGGKSRPLRAAKILSYEEESVVVEAEARTESVLVLSDLYHSFWRVRVDGKGAALFPVFHAFRGLRLTPGDHRVEFYCEIPWFRFGWAASAFFFLVSVALSLRALFPSQAVVWRPAHLFVQKTGN